MENATLMGNPLHVPYLVRALWPVVPTKKTPQSATNMVGARLSSKLDDLAYIISPVLPESLGAPRPSLLPVPSSSNPDKWYGEAALHCHSWPGADRYHGQRDVG